MSGELFYFMKKLSIIMVSLILCSMAGLTAFAGNSNALRIESVESDSGKDEIYALRDKIAKRVNDIISGENTEHLYSKNTHGHISSEDIDFNNMYKQYGNANEILTKNLTGRDAMNFLENCDDYIWVMPISLGDITITVILGVGQPLIEERAYATDENGNRFLSDEKISELRNNVGRWQINAVGIDYLDTRYEDAIAQANEIQYKKAINDTLYYIFLPNLHTYAAFIATDEGNYINCFNRYLIGESGKNLKDDFIGQEEIIEANNKYMAENSENRAGGISSVYVGDKTNYDSDGKSNCMIIIIIVCSAVFGGLLMYIKKHSKKLGIK